MTDKHLTNYLVVLAAIAAGIAFGYYFGWQRAAENTPTPTPEQVFCTQDAMMCPDGSYVGRIPPACNFAPCPAGWLTKTEDGVTFRYPAETGLTYVSFQDLPTVDLEEESFSCVAAGSETDRAGRTELITTSDNHRFCRTIVMEGAAGSTYTMYAYAFNHENHENEVAYIRFTTREPQCLNYDEPNQSACQREQEEFNPDRIADLISHSITH